MNSPWLLLDVSYLCWRAYYTTGKLSHQGVRTGVAFGFLRDVRNLMDLHGTSNIAFCFDYGSPFRCNIYRKYKQNPGRKKNLTPEELQAFNKEVRLIRKEHLPAIGFKNLLFAEGYEADDVIASVVSHLTEGLNGDNPQGNQAIIVSADKDLYQLLAPGISVWLPSKNKAVTHESFKEEWGVPPWDWPTVKAIAGCVSDNIRGVDGVGEKTAAKFMAGTLAENSAAWLKIDKVKYMWTKNLKLVRLPFPGTPTFPLVEDEVTERKWKKVLDDLGIKSLKEKKPGGFGMK